MQLTTYDITWSAKKLITKHGCGSNMEVWDTQWKSNPLKIICYSNLLTISQREVTKSYLPSLFVVKGLKYGASELTDNGLLI